MTMTRLRPRHLISRRTSPKPRRIAQGVGTLNIRMGHRRHSHQMNREAATAMKVRAVVTTTRVVAEIQRVAIPPSLHPLLSGNGNGGERLVVRDTDMLDANLLEMCSVGSPYRLQTPRLPCIVSEPAF